MSRPHLRLILASPFDTRPLKGRLGGTGVLKDTRLAEPRLQPTGNETRERLIRRDVPG